MIFHARHGRALARIEASLTRSDPALAAEFEHFNTQARRSPDGHERRAVAKRLVALAILPLAVLFAGVATSTATGKAGGAGRCFAVTGAAWPSNGPACRAASAPLSPEGIRPCGTRSPLKTP